MLDRRTALDSLSPGELMAPKRTPSGEMGHCAAARETASASPRGSAARREVGQSQRAAKEPEFLYSADLSPSQRAAPTAHSIRKRRCAIDGITETLDRRRGGVHRYMVRQESARCVRKGDVMSVSSG
jgi:hypothetical protein